MTTATRSGAQFPADASRPLSPRPPEIVAGASFCNSNPCLRAKTGNPRLSPLFPVSQVAKSGGRGELNDVNRKGKLVRNFTHTVRLLPIPTTPGGEWRRAAGLKGDQRRPSAILRP